MEGLPGLVRPSGMEWGGLVLGAQSGGQLSSRNRPFPACKEEGFCWGPGQQAKGLFPLCSEVPRV